MKKTVWILLDNRMGSVGQARGVAQALDTQEFDVVEKSITYTCLAKIPNILKGASLIGANKSCQRDLQAPWADLVISASRRTAPIARWIKKQSKNKTKIVQLMHPGNAGLEDFDAIFVSEHDRQKKSTANINYIIGSPHRVTEQSLEKACDKWSTTFADMPKPLTAVIIGGTVKGRILSQENASRLGQEIRNLKDKIGGSLLITDSKRTGLEARNAILNEIDDIQSYNFLWGQKGENPYLGYLACADNIIVTGDSVSMCCEACGTGRPVYIFKGENWLSSKHLRFVDSLLEGKYAVALDDINIIDFFPQRQLNPAHEIANKIKELFELA